MTTGTPQNTLNRKTPIHRSTRSAILYSFIILIGLNRSLYAMNQPVQAQAIITAPSSKVKQVIDQIVQNEYPTLHDTIEFKVYTEPPMMPSAHNIPLSAIPSDKLLIAVASENPNIILISPYFHNYIYRSTITTGGEIIPIPFVQFSIRNMIEQSQLSQYYQAQHPGKDVATIPEIVHAIHEQAENKALARFELGQLTQLKKNLEDSKFNTRPEYTSLYQKVLAHITQEGEKLMTNAYQAPKRKEKPRKDYDWLHRTRKKRSDTQ
jgi:hypothetical protein